MPFASITVDVAPWRLSGVVYGVLLNHRAALAALGDALEKPPYKAAPRAPVMYIKPRNTLAGPGDTVIVPPDVPALEAGAALGVVIGRTACRVDETRALDCVAGYTIVNDVSIPHDSYYRPSLRYKARDGFCPLGPRVVAAGVIGDPARVTLRTFVDGVLVHTAGTADLVRPLARLLADVTEFMTLSPGDLLMLGVAPGAPRVRAGQTVAIEVDGIGRLQNAFLAAPAAESAPRTVA